MTCRSSLLGPGDAEDMVILGCIPRLFGILILVIGNYFLRRGPWGPNGKWAGTTNSLAPQ